MDIFRHGRVGSAPVTSGRNLKKALRALTRSQEFKGVQAAAAAVTSAGLALTCRRSSHSCPCCRTAGAPGGQ